MSGHPEWHWATIRHRKGAANGRRVLLVTRLVR